MSRRLRNAFAATWLLMAVFFGTTGADPAYTAGAITCATVFVASGGER